MFKIDDIIVDRILEGYAEDFSGNLLYILTQLQDAKINIGAESKDAKDKDGTLIKKFWKGKSGTFEATNAMLNLNILAASSGSAKEVASDSNKITMPKTIKVKSGQTVTLKDFVAGSVVVVGQDTNGTMGKSYAQAATASDTEFGITSAGVLTPPTDTDVAYFKVKYKRTVSSGVAIRNRADKFTGTVKLTLKALCVDPCSADTLRACYIELPSFQVSPETEISLGSDSTTLAYKGDLQVDYCSEDKALYNIYMAEDDEEDNE